MLCLAQDDILQCGEIALAHKRIIRIDYQIQKNTFFNNTLLLFLYYYSSYISTVSMYWPKYINIIIITETDKNIKQNYSLWGGHMIRRWFLCHVLSLCQLQSNWLSFSSKHHIWNTDHYLSVLIPGSEYFRMYIYNIHTDDVTESSINVINFNICVYVCVCGYYPYFIWWFVW